MATVELVYLPQEQPAVHLIFEFKAGMRVADLIELAGLQEQYPEVKHLPVGIFSKQVSLEDVLQPGDRVEIYRPLQIDPKEKRRRRAQK